MDWEKIGTVRSRSGKVFEVWWDSATNDIQVKDRGTLIARADDDEAPVGKASSASEAMRIAEKMFSDK